MKIAKNNRVPVTAGIMVAVAIIGLIAIAFGPTSTEAGSVASEPKLAVTDASGNLGESGYGATVMPSLLKMAGALVVVIICIYGGLFLLKRLMGGRHSSNGRADTIEVLQTIHLSPRQTVSLIRVANRAVLIGACENNISPLTELDAADVAELLTETEESSDSNHPRGFLDTALRSIKNANVLSTGRSDRVKV